MVSYVLGIIIGFLVFAGLFCWAAQGFRNGDRETDALISAALRSAVQPGEHRPVVIATVRNPSGSPVLAGFAVHRGRLPLWLAGPRTSGVPRRTARRAFRPGGYPTVGVVPAWSSQEFAVPVRAGARRYLLTVAVGQADDRLRVHRLRLSGARFAVSQSLAACRPSR